MYSALRVAQSTVAVDVGVSDNVSVGVSEFGTAGLSLGVSVANLSKVGVADSAVSVRVGVLLNSGVGVALGDEVIVSVTVFVSVAEGSAFAVGVLSS
jgi:hypothetical protein